MSVDADTAERVVDAYFAAWNERDPDLRAALLHEAVTEACELSGPTGTFKGRGEILKLIAALQERMEGASTLRSGPVEVGENGIRVPWEVRSTGGDPLLGGVETVRLATDGRLSLISVVI